VVEGFQKFEPGDVVDPVPWQPMQARDASSAPNPEGAELTPARYSNAR
jgi:hypothetical protein